MPSVKKRINLTVPDNIYERIQVYKEDNGLANDATACLQLIVRQLKAEKDGRTLLDFMGKIPQISEDDKSDGNAEFISAFEKLLNG